MTTAQESLTHAFPPFPFFVENPVELERHDLPANRNNHNPNLCHAHMDTNPLPDRCQFTFSDGRQCTMPRSDIHPCLCRYHSEREDQLFGEPGSRTVGAALDLPELYSACSDLTTAAGVNRALGQVFRLLAQRRISRQEAATFCHLAQLLLRSISAARSARESHGAPLGRAKVYPQDELLRVNKSHQELSRGNKVTAADRVPNMETSPPPQPAALATPATLGHAGDPIGVRTSSSNGNGDHRELSPGAEVEHAAAHLFAPAAAKPASAKPIAATSPVCASPPSRSPGIARPVPTIEKQVSRIQHLQNFST